MVKSRQIYRHFKGNQYIVICTAKHTETEEDMVIYRRLDQPLGQLWCRSASMFTEELDKKKYPDAKQTYRFELIEDA